MLKVNRIGVSTFIAALILMVLAVTAGVVIYAYSMGYLSGITSIISTPVSLSLDASSLSSTGEVSEVTLTAYIRNIGTKKFVMDSVYVNGVKITHQKSGTSGWFFEPEVGLIQDQTGKLTISQDPIIDNSDSQSVAVTFKDNISYEIQIIGTDNSRLKFIVRSSGLATFSNLLLNSAFENGVTSWKFESQNVGHMGAYLDSDVQHDGLNGYFGVTDTWIDMVPQSGVGIYSKISQDLSTPLKISSLPDTEVSLQAWINNNGPTVDGFYDTAEIRIVTETKTLSYIFGGTRSDSSTVYISLGGLSNQGVWVKISRNLLKDLLFSGISNNESITRIELVSNGLYVNNLRYGQIIRWDDLKLYTR
jgi:hypothetical protein